MMDTVAGENVNPSRALATGAILRTLAQVAPDHREAKTAYDVGGSGASAMAWLGPLPSDVDSGEPFVSLSAGTPGSAVGARLTTSASVHPTPALDQLQRFAALTPGLPVLRIGWLWISGTIEIDGHERRLRLPLLSRSVAVTHRFGQRRITPLDAWDLWPLVDDHDKAADLERAAAFAFGLDGRTTDAELLRMYRLPGWIGEVINASHLPRVQALTTTAPEELRRSAGLTASAGYAVYAEQTVESTHPQETLRGWAGDPGVGGTALAELYLGALPPPPGPPPADPGSMFPLTERQAEIVTAARTDSVVTVSGPPGTGKSQTAAAIALDAVARGQRVLVATQSRAAADVLAELLDRVPGPTPVLFGGGNRASKLAAKLADGIAAPPGTGAADRHRAAATQAVDLERSASAELRDLTAGLEWERAVLTLAGHALVAPRLLDPDATVSTATASDLLDRARNPGSGWLVERRRAKADRRLRAALGAPPDVSLDDVAAAISVAERRDRAARGADRSVVTAAARWAALEEADRARRLARAEALAEEVARRPDADARRAVAALATALRGGQAGRRSHLATVDVGALTDALPLWVGTLGEIETLLPAVAGAFDLVILDEASQIDQVAASSALLRANRAVVIGDPRQLRFVSFVADADVSAAIAAEGCEWAADRLDVRRVSAFDLAASAAPVRFLDEHFRSVPHLIGFSARHFYDDRLLVATRHPANECVDAIDVIRVDGTKADGVNEAEVDATLASLHELLADPGQPGPDRRHREPLPGPGRRDPRTGRGRASHRGPRGGSGSGRHGPRLPRSGVRRHDRVVRPERCRRSRPPLPRGPEPVQRADHPRPAAPDRARLDGGSPARAARRLPALGRPGPSAGGRRTRRRCLDHPARHGPA